MVHVVVGDVMAPLLRIVDIICRPTVECIVGSKSTVVRYTAEETL